MLGGTQSRNCQLTLTELTDGGQLAYQQRWAEHLDRGLPGESPDKLVVLLAERGAADGSEWVRWPDEHVPLEDNSVDEMRDLRGVVFIHCVRNPRGPSSYQWRNRSDIDAWIY